MLGSNEKKSINPVDTNIPVSTNMPHYALKNREPGGNTVYSGMASPVNIPQHSVPVEELGHYRHIE